MAVRCLTMIIRHGCSMFDYDNHVLYETISDVVLSVMHVQLIFILKRVKNAITIKLLCICNFLHCEV